MIQESLNNVAIWFAKPDNYDDLTRYSQRIWNDSGDAEDSKFAKEFDLSYFDIDNCEFDLITNFNYKEILSSVSYWDRFLEKSSLLSKLQEMSLHDFGALMLIYDYKYIGDTTSSSNAIFIGNFKYEN